MGAKTLLSLQEFIELPKDGMRHELDAGELITMPPPKFLHTRIAKRAFRILEKAAELYPAGEAYSEPGVRLRPNLLTIWVPDVAFVRAEQILSTAGNNYLEGAPALVVEVLSPFDSKARMTKKVHEWLAAGASVVWLIDPPTETVQVCRPDGSASTLNVEDALDAPELFPGWSAPVFELFRF